MRQKGSNKGVLVCFEGGDAAGKTTLAFSVAEELQRRGMDFVMIDKKSVEGFQEPYLVDRLKDLRRVLWDYPPEAPLWEWGDHHWFHLIVSWFSILDHCRVQPLLNEGKLVIVDNWYYKFAARFLLKSDFDRHSVLSSFEHLSVPNLVIFVDVDPRIAVTRRAEFSATESGKLDGHTGGGVEDFICYQEKVIQQMRCLTDDSWVRIDAARLPMIDLVSEASELIARYNARCKLPMGTLRGPLQ